MRLGATASAPLRVITRSRAHAGYMVFREPNGTLQHSNDSHPLAYIAVNGLLGNVNGTGQYHRGGPLISVNLTINGLFSQVLYAFNPSNSFFGCQSGAPSASSISKFQRSAPKINLSSTYVKFLPMHPRGPVEKGCAAFLESPANFPFDSGVSRKRSGMKESGSAKLDAECDEPDSAADAVAGL